MMQSQFEALIRSAQQELTKLNKECAEQHGLGTFERWDYRADDGTITFSNGGRPVVVAQVQVVGTTSARSNMWLWARANDSIPSSLQAASLVVREFGASESLSPLTEAELADDEFLGWEMAAITVKLAGGVGAYRTPRAGGGFTYYVLSAIGPVEDGLVSARPS